jgi:hypothetical protein
MARRRKMSVAPGSSQASGAGGGGGGGGGGHDPKQLLDDSSSSFGASFRTGNDFSDVDTALKRSVEEGEKMRSMFTDHNEDEVLRIAGTEGGVMALAQQFVEMRQNLEESEIK